MSRENDGQNNEGDMVDNSTPGAITTSEAGFTLATPEEIARVENSPHLEIATDNGTFKIPVDETGAMSAEDEATLAMLMGDAGSAELLSSLGLGKPAAPSREQVEEMAKQRELARTYDVYAGITRVMDAVDSMYAQFNELMSLMNDHATLEYNKALIAEEEQQTYEDCLPVERLRNLNAVRFLQLGAQDIDKGLALLKVSVLR